MEKYDEQEFAAAGEETLVREFMTRYRPVVDDAGFSARVCRRIVRRRAVSELLPLLLLLTVTAAVATALYVRFRDELFIAAGREIWRFSAFVGEYPHYLLAGFGMLLVALLVLLGIAMQKTDRCAGVFRY